MGLTTNSHWTLRRPKSDKYFARQYRTKIGRIFRSTEHYIFTAKYHGKNWCLCTVLRTFTDWHLRKLRQQYGSFYHSTVLTNFPFFVPVYISINTREVSWGMCQLADADNYNICSVSENNKTLDFWVIMWAKVDQFSNFFHWLVPK